MTELAKKQRVILVEDYSPINGIMQKYLARYADVEIVSVNDNAQAIAALSEGSTVAVVMGTEHFHIGEYDVNACLKLMPEICSRFRDVGMLVVTTAESSRREDVVRCCRQVGAGLVTRDMAEEMQVRMLTEIIRMRLMPIADRVPVLTALLD